METKLKTGNWILMERGTNRAIAVFIIDESPTGYSTSQGHFYIKAEWNAVVRCEASLVLQMPLAKEGD